MKVSHTDPAPALLWFLGVENFFFSACCEIQTLLFFGSLGGQEVSSLCFLWPS